MPGTCPSFFPPCDICQCTGLRCQRDFPGLKVEWPELKGVSGTEAKKIIERDNPKVTVVIIPDSMLELCINCCNRVLLRVPDDNCPNGPVLNHPQVG